MTPLAYLRREVEFGFISDKLAEEVKRYLCKQFDIKCSQFNRLRLQGSKVYMPELPDSPIIDIDEAINKVKRS